jgi:hypothetical protein
MVLLGPPPASAFNTKIPTRSALGGCSGSIQSRGRVRGDRLARILPQVAPAYHALRREPIGRDLGWCSLDYGLRRYSPRHRRRGVNHSARTVRLARCPLAVLGPPSGRNKPKKTKSSARSTSEIERRLSLIRAWAAILARAYGLAWDDFVGGNAAGQTMIGTERDRPGSWKGPRDHLDLLLVTYAPKAPKTITVRSIPMKNKLERSVASEAVSKENMAPSIQTTRASAYS